MGIGSPAAASLSSDLALGAFGWLNSAVILVNLYYLVKQLSAVSAVHNAATNINLFDWQPMFAFSSLTYRTTAISVVLISAFVVVFPSLTLNPIGLVLVLSGYLLAGPVFFLPLSGLHAKLQDEKHRLLGVIGLPMLIFILQRALLVLAGL